MDSKSTNERGPSLVSSLDLSCLYKTFFMYLRAVLCTFQISVDFYCVPVGGEEGGEEGGEGLERVGVGKGQKRGEGDII
jgi:hypothetical protein